jgi:hypothetical protein
VDSRLNLLKLCCALPPAQVVAGHNCRGILSVVDKNCNKFMMVKMEEDTGRGFTGSDITDQNISEIHAISKISASDEKYPPYVEGNTEMDLSLGQELASGKLFFNRACFNVPVHVCSCILDVFSIPHLLRPL